MADPARADQAGEGHPAAVIAPPGAIVDCVPGNRYWTRIVAGLVGPTGHLCAIWPSFLANHANDVPVLQARHLPGLAAELQSTPLPSVPFKHHIDSGPHRQFVFRFCSSR